MAAWFQTGWVGLGDAHLGIDSINLPQGLADLAHGGVSANGIHDVGHRVGVGNLTVAARLRFLRGEFLQSVKTTAYFFIRAACAQGFEFSGLLARHGFIDVENIRSEERRVGKECKSRRWRY